MRTRHELAQVTTAARPSSVRNFAGSLRHRLLILFTMADKLRDNVSRTKRLNIGGTSVFIGLRSADVFLQYGLLQRGWASKIIHLLGGSAVDSARVLDATGTQLQPYYGILSLMALGSSLKQVVHMLTVSEQEMDSVSAVVISLVNTVFNGVNGILSVWALTTQVPNEGTLADVLQSPAVLLALGFYMTGIMAELVSELQRKNFKKDPANKGKAYAGGLFSWARHINYGGYTIWRTAYATAAAGWPWGAIVFSWFFYDFAARGVPVLDRYMSDRVGLTTKATTAKLTIQYGEQWKAIKARVPYRLIPGIY